MSLEQNASTSHSNNLPSLAFSDLFIGLLKDSF